MHLRAEYRVGPDLRFLSNLDMMHLMERALRRAEIPYMLSAGFNPHIRLSMGTVLPVGLWGEREYFDLELDSLPLTEFQERMNQALPAGILIRACQQILAGTPSLMKSVNAAEYAFLIQSSRERLEAAAAVIWQQTQVQVRSRGKNKQLVKDLRPGLYAIEITPNHDRSILSMKVSVNEPVNVRFDELEEVLANFGVGSALIVDCWRRANYIKQGQEYLSPLDIF